METLFWTKPNGHKISLFYTLIILTAIGFLIVPSDAFRWNFGWAIALAMPIAAAAFTFLTRLFTRNGIVRCRTSVDAETGAKGFHIGANSINLDEVTRIVKLSRPGIFGSELQFFEGRITPSAIVVLGELKQPDLLVETVKNLAPRAAYVESYTGLHFLDWGLGVSLAALLVIALSKVL